MKKLFVILAILLVTSLAIGQVIRIGEFGITDGIIIGGHGVLANKAGTVVDYTGTYWAEARTDYWTDTREALWDTARNTEVPE